MSVVEEENPSSYNIWRLKLDFRDLDWTFRVTYYIFIYVFSPLKGSLTKKKPLLKYLT
jgi:hypothetical protein